MEHMNMLSDKWEVILAIIYMIYNEIKRKQSRLSNLVSDKLKLSQQLSKEEQKDIDNKIQNSMLEIERFVTNKFKHYKSRILVHFEGDVELVRIAVDGILLNVMLKIQKELIIHINKNGYHNLNHTELDSYITYISECLYDIFVRKLDKYEHMIEILKHINMIDLETYVRDIFETSINITNRIKLKK